MSYLSGAASELRSYHFTYPERKLTMEEMLYKFIDKGKRKHEEMRAFIYDFPTTNEILFKERNNSLIELRFGVQELLKVINNTLMIDYEVKGVTTKGLKTMTQDAQNNDTNIRTEEPLTDDQLNQRNPPRKRRSSAEEVFRKPKAVPHKSAFHRGPGPMPKYAKFLKDSSWVSPIHVVPKKGGMTVVLNDDNELIPSRTVTGWRDSSKFQSHPKIKKRQHSPVLMRLLLTEECLLGYAMLQLLFKDAWQQFSTIWWKTLWKYSWTISRCLVTLLIVV
ncbi:hypothetical protein Tco_1288582 [Tanacetum coccineum]